MKGHTLLEILIVLGLFTVIFTATSLNLLGARSKTSLGTSVDVLLADLRAQQTKAMSGDTGGGGTNVNFGIHFLSNSYVLFKNTYSASDPYNYSVNLDDVKIDTTFSGSEIIFLKGSGEVSGYNPVANTIRLTSLSSSGSPKIITINRFGVIISVN